MVKPGREPSRRNHRKHFYVSSEQHYTLS